MFHRSSDGASCATLRDEELSARKTGHFMRGGGGETLNRDCGRTGRPETPNNYSSLQLAFYG
jgi:hypothetical protein